MMCDAKAGRWDRKQKDKYTKNLAIGSSGCGGCKNDDEQNVRMMRCRDTDNAKSASNESKEMLK